MNRLRYDIHKAINYKSHRFNIVNRYSLTHYMKQFKYKSYTIEPEIIERYDHPRSRPHFSDNKIHSQYKIFK